MLDLGGSRAGTGARTAPLPVAPVEKRQSRLGRWFDNWLRSVGMAVILFVIIKTFLVEAFQIPSGSMERTLLAGDFLFVNKAVYGAQIPGTKARLPGFESPRRGDVIVFAYPKNPELNYVKRVIGLPGDTVVIRHGVVSVDGRRLVEPYLGRPPDLHDYGPYVVAPGHREDDSRDATGDPEPRHAPDVPAATHSATRPLLTNRG